MNLNSFIRKNKLKSSFLIIFVIIVCFLIYNYNSGCKEAFTLNIENDTTMEERSTGYETLMKDFDTIFPDRNRNSGGPQFFKHIVDMNLSKHDFELYNSFYCGVSGSPVDPKRVDVSDNVIVKDLKGNDIYGKYYRCCWPCLCDIMKYARVDKYDIVLDIFKRDLLDTYVNANIKKELEKKEISFQLKPLVYELHGIYLKTHKKINSRKVEEYIMSLEPDRLTFILKYYL